jgi:TonB family protein
MFLSLLVLHILAYSPGPAGGQDEVSGFDVFRVDRNTWASGVSAAIKAKLRSPERPQRTAATLRMAVGMDGRITNVRIVKSSGDSQADLALVQACYEASPVTPPPGGATEELDITFDGTGSAQPAASGEPSAPGLEAPGEPAGTGEQAAPAKAPDIKEITALLTAERYADALPQLNALIAEPNPDTATFILRGAALLAMGKAAEAGSDFTKATELDSNSKLALTGRGACYRMIKKSEQAVADFTSALAAPAPAVGSQPGEAEHILINALRKGLAWPFPDLKTALLGLRGTAYFYLKKYDKALEDFTAIIDANPKFAPAYNARGLTYLETNQAAKAEIEFNKAIELDDKSAKYYEARGRLYETQEKYDKALADLNRAVSLNPQCAACYWTRGLVYEATGEAIAASQNMQKAAALGFRPPVQKQSAKVIVHMHSVKMAAELYAVNHDGVYPLAIDDSFKEYLKAGGGDPKSRWPMVNPFTYRVEWPIPGRVLDVARLRASRPSPLPPGVVEYSPVANGQSYAIRGGGPNGRALPGTWEGSATLVLSTDN